ncbi:MAG: hypothetical protein RIQ93_1796 [Verrucomicrobiota bacterium]|jgi:hypothetical protein
MSKATFGLGCVGLIAVAAGFFMQHRGILSLRREVAMLRNELRLAGAERAARPAPRPIVAADGAAAPSRASDGEREDLARLREEIAALRKSTTALAELAQTAQAAQALAKSSTSVATKLAPVSEWKNAGRGTPAASTETVLWAAVGGDVETLANTLTFTDSARLKADAWFAGLSDNTRQQYGSPEKVLALMIAREAEGVSGMQVLGQKEIGQGDVGLRLRFANADGKTKDQNFLLRPGADGWRMVLPDSVVEKYAGQLSGAKRPGN